MAQAEPSKPARAPWGKAFLLLVAVAWLSVIWLWAAAPLALPVDDAHYYFVIAKNVVSGEGMSFDGLEPTNGVHPLWLAVLVPIAALARGEMDELVRIVLTLQVFLVVGAFVGLARSSTMPWLRRLPVVAAVLLVNPYVAKVVINGQEAALALAFAALCWTAWSRAEARPTQLCRWLFLGLFTGLLPLARLEGLTMSVALWFLSGFRARKNGWGLSWLSGAVLATGIVAGWWLWSLWEWGHVLPVSGLIKTQDSGRSWEPWAIALSVAWGVAVFAALAPFVRRAPQLVRSFVPLFVWVSCTLGGQWLLVGSILPPPWYFTPALLLGAGLVAALPRRGLRDRLVALGVLALALPCWHYRLDPLSYRTYAEARAAGQWLKRHTPDGTRAGGWDCGFVAAYADRPVSNLEGLVSSLDFKQRYLDPRRVDAFLQKNEITYLAQYYPEWWLERVAGKGGEVLLEGRVPASAWTVANARCFWARRIYAPTPRKYWYFILRRNPARPSLAEFARSIDDSPNRCAESPL